MKGMHICQQTEEQEQPQNIKLNRIKSTGHA